MLSFLAAEPRTSPRNGSVLPSLQNRIQETSSNTIARTYEDDAMEQMGPPAVSAAAEQTQPLPATNLNAPAQPDHDTNGDANEPHANSPGEARSGEVQFAGLNRPSVARLQQGMEIGNELVPSQKDCVRALRKYTTLTNAEIFRRVGVSNSNGYRYLRNEPEKDPDEKAKPGRGRKRKLDETVMKQVLQEIEKQPAGEKTKSWEELCKNAQVDVTPITLKRAVENAGYYKCPACQRGKECELLRGVALIRD
jgi:transposase